MIYFQINYAIYWHDLDICNYSHAPEPQPTLDAGTGKDDSNLGLSLIASGHEECSRTRKRTQTGLSMC